MGAGDSLSDEQNLGEMVTRWETQRGGDGRPLTAEELCLNHPHLMERLRKAILEMENTKAGEDTDSTTTPPRPVAPMPESIGPYRILEVLGEGGMGTVYKAEQRAPLKRAVALKVIKAGFDTAEVLARFMAEHQVLARLDHPNIARVYDAGMTERGRPYFAMEYLPGRPITRFCDENKLSIRHRLELFRQACDAITHAHMKAIVHRDIKASNVLAFIHDGKPMVKVIDFGIAKALSGDRLTEHTFNTGRGAIVGTYDTMSPEQADGSPDIDTRTDVYSLGVLLYELLTGAKPFDARTFDNAADGEIRRIIREVDPPRPSTRLSGLGHGGEKIAAVRQARVEQLTRELKSDLEWIPLKAMRKERQERYASPRELSEDIENYLNGRPLLARPPSRIYQVRKFVRRNAKPLVASVCVVAACIGGSGFYLYRIKQEQARTNAALQAEHRAREAETVQRHAAQENLIAADFKQAELAAQRGEWDQSLAAYTSARDAGAEDVRRVLLGRVTALRNVGREADARSEMDRAIRQRPDLADDPLVMLHRGELIWATDPTQSESLLRTAIAKGLPASDAAFARGLLAETIPEAIAQFKRAVAADPFRQDTISLIALLSTILGQWSDADEYTIAWQRMFPDDPGARITRAIQFALRRDGAGANRILDESEKLLDPKLARDLHRLVDAVVVIGKDSGDLNLASANSMFGLSNSLQSKYELGIERSDLLYPRAIGRAASKVLNGLALESKGGLLKTFRLEGAAAGQWTQAIDEYAEVEKELPVGVFMMKRGQLLIAAKRLPEALQEFEKATEASSPIDVRGYAHMYAAVTMCLIDQGDKDRILRTLADPRVARHLRMAAQLGAMRLGPPGAYWRNSVQMLTTGGHTADARILLADWESALPDDPMAGVLEAQVEYFAGNYGAALRIVDGLDGRFPGYDFAAMGPLRSACRAAIRDGRITPPELTGQSIHIVTADPYFEVPRKSTTRPTTGP